ncbi:DinB family protein [Lewinella sp. W8]|uniref:DinB family protein n=1 Tax=Lewinella sp. W8 TaxID=2528208 RepID=UPI00106723AA|nr:DinB family protein [Lewinella sp. W8]MTB51667.1 DinB family protein [Lewinella sp. W8]
MKARSSRELIDKLIDRTQSNLEVAREMLALPVDTLHLRPRPEAWNALECLEHLNRYAEYYNPEIRRRLESTKHRTQTESFTSTRLGNYFAAGMKPGPQTKKISTFKSMNPHQDDLGVEVVHTFIKYQEDMLELLEAARSVDLTRTKTGISITNLIKLRLGDTLRVVVYHNWRHVAQAQAAMAQSTTPIAS